MTVMSRAERLTPDVEQSASFRTARLGRRGLDEQHVRAFCDQVEAELATLHHERATLQTEVGRLRRRVLGLSGEDDGFGPGRVGSHLQAVSILSRAQETAEHYVTEAQEYSRHLAQDARRRRDEILAEAHDHADQMMDDAHREAVQAAHTALAAPLPDPQSPADARELEAEVAYLRTFSEVYRTHLRAYLDALLRTADHWDHAELPSPTPSPGPNPGPGPGPGDSSGWVPAQPDTASWAAAPTDSPSWAAAPTDSSA
jgi:cell division septum initiation protein DivIVA